MFFLNLDLPQGCKSWNLSPGKNDGHKYIPHRYDQPNSPNNDASNVPGLQNFPQIDEACRNDHTNDHLKEYALNEIDRLKFNVLGICQIFEDSVFAITAH